MTDNEIRDWLAPQWGLTVVPCLRCVQSGKIYDGTVEAMTVTCPDCHKGWKWREWVKCPECKNGISSSQHYMGSCRKCEGEGRIPDTEGRAVIVEAVFRYFRVLPAGYSSWWDAWERRHKPNKPALEDFVREYRRPVAALDTSEGGEWLKARLWESPRVAEFTLKWYRSASQGRGVVASVSLIGGGGAMREADTEHAALRAAVKAAKEASE